MKSNLELKMMHREAWASKEEELVQSPISYKLVSKSIDMFTDSILQYTFLDSYTCHVNIDTAHTFP
jgi:hypothetical protein